MVHTTLCGGGGGGGAPPATAPLLGLAAIALCVCAMLAVHLLSLHRQGGRRVEFRAAPK